MAWVLEGAGGGAHDPSFGAVLSARVWVLPWLYPIQYSVVALAWHQTQTKDVASARFPPSWVPASGAFPTCGSNSKLPTRQIPAARARLSGLFLVWSTGKLPAVSVQSTRDDSGVETGWEWIAIARGRHAHCIPIMATHSSPCGFSDTVYFIRYLPTAPCRVGVGATVRDAD